MASRKTQPITAAEAKNARPYDLDQAAINDLWEEAQQWLTDDFVIETEAQAEGLERLVKMSRAAKNEADAHRKAENEPFDTGKAEVQARYNPLFSTADTIIKGSLGVLTVWRDKLATKQREEAAAVRRAAEEAAALAAKTAKIAGTNVSAIKIADDAAETAERFTKTANRMEKKAGTGLRMRTVYDFEIMDIKQAIAHYYRTEPAAMEAFINERIRGGLPNQRAVPGVAFTERKEAY
jgi:hypothetical protein